MQLIGNLLSQAGKTEYSALVTDLSPQNLQPYKYKIEVTGALLRYNQSHAKMNN